MINKNVILDPLLGSLLRNVVINVVEHGMGNKIEASLFINEAQMEKNY